MRLLIIVLGAMLLAGCTDAPITDDARGDDGRLGSEGSEPTTSRDPLATNVTISHDASFTGTLEAAVCTFGPLRHQCDPLPGQAGPVYSEIGTFAAPTRLEGTVAYDGDPLDPPRIDIFLLADHGDGYRWDHTTDPFATGASPQGFSWDLSAYADLPLMLFVFGSHAQYVDPVGVSVVTPVDITVDAVLYQTTAPGI